MHIPPARAFLLAQIAACRELAGQGPCVLVDHHSGAALASAGRYFGLDNGAWIKDLGGERYQTDWTAEERWGRVEQIETDEAGNVTASETLGFMLLRVDRSHGLL